MGKKQKKPRMPSAAPAGLAQRCYPLRCQRVALFYCPPHEGLRRLGVSLGVNGAAAMVGLLLVKQYSTSVRFVKRVTKISVVHGVLLYPGNVSSRYIPIHEQRPRSR